MAISSDLGLIVAVIIAIVAIGGALVAPTNALIRLLILVIGLGVAAYVDGWLPQILFFLVPH